MNQWEGVCEFVAVAETESFTAAAKQLKISVAQVSRQVSALEARLAIKLFHRTTRNVSLTESGEVYYRKCRQVLNDLAEAEDITASLHNKPTGDIRMTAPVTYGEEMIAPIINEFLLRYPDINIHLDLSNARADLINDDYDLAIRLGNLEDSRLIAQKLSSRKLHLCASDSYLSAKGAPKKLEHMRDHNCLTGTADHWRFERNKKNEYLTVTGSLRCNSGHSLVNAALKGLGIVQLPDYYLQTHLDSGALIKLLPEYEAPDEGIWVLYPDKDYLPFKTQLLINFLKESLS